MKSKVTRVFLETIILVFLLQAIMLGYIFSSFYQSAEDDVRDLGTSNLKSQATMIENYLNKGSDVLWFAADSVDFMLKKNSSKEDILQYLLGQTQKMQKQYDANFTGIYGLLGGNYIDGSGWEPPEDYDPRTRDWYKEGVASKGEMSISAPYVDAQTGKVIVSFAQMLSDNDSVIALDVTLDGVQNITEHMTMGDIGYGFIVDDEGLVIAHSDPSQVGKNYRDDKNNAELFTEIITKDDGTFETNVNEESSTVFTNVIAKDWHVVIVANNSLLFKELRKHLTVGLILSVLIFLIIVLVCVISIRMLSKAEKKEKESLEQLQKMNMNIIRALASTIDAKDRYTSGHSQRVADYAVRLAKKLGKSEEEQQVIFYAGLLHDVGKIRVPVEVINKPGKLTDEEFDQIRIHPVSGYHILRDINDDERVGYGAKYHHERYDGKGYPNGLEAENIPEVARIIAVADAYDAMASNRSYRNILPQEVVREEIVKGKGTQFDPEVADAMLEIMAEDKEYALRQNEEKVYNVLVVDDDDLIIHEIEGMLDDVEGVKVIGANNRRETFAALVDKNISVILLDLMMPEVSGFELYEEIKKEFDVPIILMTGDKSSETVKRIRELKIDDYLTKPFNKAVTKETIHGILHKNTAQI